VCVCVVEHKIVGNSLFLTLAGKKTAICLMRATRGAAWGEI